jgi:O-antigen/teichoic acid export membrane protein
VSDAVDSTEAEHPALARLARGVTLSQGARFGGFWMAAASLGTQAFQFLVSIVMARLLLPSQFGETALVYAMAAFAQIFTDLGLSAAVVHARRVTEELLSSAFWLNAITGVGLTLVVSALAVPLSVIYGEPNLVGLIILVSLNFTFSLGAVQLALLERSFNFRRIAMVETISAVVGIAAVPIAALLGLGVYSLVLGPLLTTCLLSASLWASVRWWPKRGASRSALRELWSFSRGLVGFNAVNYWSRNLDNLLLGGTVSSADLGEYNRAYNLMLIPVGQMGAVLMRVLYPALARMRDEPARMGRAWSRAVAAATGSFTLPLTLTMAATAPALVEVLYGPRWTGMVTVLELLSLAAVPQILGAATGGPYRAAGRTGLLFKLGMVSSAITVVAIIAGLPWGTTGVATALLIKSWVCLPIVVAPLARVLHLPVRELLFPAIAGWGPAAAAVTGELLVRFLAPADLAAWKVLLLQLCVGGPLYLAAMWRSDSEPSRAAKGRLRRLATSLHRVSTDGAS